MEDDFIPDYEIGPDIEDPPSPPRGNQHQKRENVSNMSC